MLSNKIFPAYDFNQETAIVYLISYLYHIINIIYFYYKSITFLIHKKFSVAKIVCIIFKLTVSILNKM